MNWGKLKRTIERDFKRNPAKTGVLLALLPLAGYFVGPLVWKMVFKKEAHAPTGTVALAETNPLVASPTQSATAKSSSTPWHEVAARIADDSRMASAAVAGLRNPFEGEPDLSAKIAELEIEKSQEDPDPAEDTSRPEDFGLQLTSTIVGEHLKLATINGKQYRENARLPILQLREGTAPAGKMDAAFIVKRVAKKYVVLEREGKLYELQLSR